MQQQHSEEGQNRCKQKKINFHFLHTKAPKKFKNHRCKYRKYWSDFLGPSKNRDTIPLKRRSVTAFLGQKGRYYVWHPVLLGKLGEFLNNYLPVLLSAFPRAPERNNTKAKKNRNRFRTGRLWIWPFCRVHRGHYSTPRSIMHEARISKHYCAANSGSPEVELSSVRGLYCSNIELGGLTWSVFFMSLLCVC